MAGKINSKRWIGTALGLILVMASASCTGKFLSWQGAYVAEQLQIPLKKGGPHQGIWETRDLQIDYEYADQNNQLTLSGHVVLNQYLTTGFQILDYLRIHLLFLDSQGKVVESTALKNFGHRRWMAVDRMNFRYVAAVPEAAVSFAFSYMGRVRDDGRARDSDGSSGGTDWEFWEVPENDSKTQSNN